MSIARVALDVPLDEVFDFGLGDAVDAPVGALVVVPFGQTRKVGVVVGHAAKSRVAADRLRPVESRVADVPVLASPELELYRFTAAYYQRPLGEVIATALPPRLRQVRRRLIAASTGERGKPSLRDAEAPTQAQKDAIAAGAAGLGRFHPMLLHGVTGSGKTEVYLRLIAAALERGSQALFLVPEIGLTPQFEHHVRERFAGARLVASHSRLGEGERARAWLDAQAGTADIVLGTRLASLMPFRSLGLIVVDEEHDPSYKQQEGVRYSARDLAVWRARSLGIPVILGSATPSLESFANARDGRYALATMPERAAGAAMPAVRTVDMRADRPHEGLTYALSAAIGKRLERSEQSLVFVNRRGFAPVLFCRSCSWHSTCRRCSANLVLHRGSGELRCHHCGHRSRAPAACPNCASADLAPIGEGTQRVEEALRDSFPSARIARVDRDSTARKGALGQVLTKVRSGELDILVGTQMLAKGHDYPDITLVGVLGADNSLFSPDFRAAERLFAQLIQVSGRAGRAKRAGEVLIQTGFPSHALYAAVASQDYARFADSALEERRLAGFPPYSHLALLRAESKKTGEARAFLAHAAREGRRLARTRGGAPGVEIFEPVPAPLERKAGFERWQLLARSASRAALQRFLAQLRESLDSRPTRRVRWSLDVDPQEV